MLLSGGYIGVIGGHVSVLSQRCRVLAVFVHIGAMGFVVWLTFLFRRDPAMLWKGVRHGNVSFTLKHNPKMFPHIVVCVWPILNLLPRKRVALVVSIYVFPSRPKPWSSLTVPKKQMDSWGSWGSRGSYVSLPPPQVPIHPHLPIQLSNDYGWFRACLSSKRSLSGSLHPWIVMATWSIGLWFEEKYCVKRNPYPLVI
jgi:nitrate reductase NapE component